MREPTRPETAKAKARLLIVDDHPVTRGGLRMLFSGEPDMEVCGEAGTAREALDLLATLKPDLLTLDLSLPDIGGMDLIKDVRARHPNVLILVFSMLDEAVHAERALHAGARGYVVKGRPQSELLRAVRRVLDGHIHLSEELADAVLRRAVHAPQPEAPSPVQRLSDREIQIFLLIGQGMGPAEIAAKLFLSPRTVETHRAHIRRKLNVEDAARLRQYAIEWVHTQGRDNVSPADGPEAPSS